LVLPLNTPPIHVETEIDAEGLATLLAHTERTWTRLGEQEPHWSVISAERFRQDRLDEHRQEFYASGQGDVDTFLAFRGRPAALAGAAARRRRGLFPGAHARRRLPLPAR
jgi:hypothetical protein